MTPVRRQPPVDQIPTMNAGEPPTTEVQERIVANQVRNARAWSDTGEDIVLNNIINEREDVRETRWQILALAVVALALLIWGTWWTYNTYRHDRFVAHERAAGEATPYRMPTVR